MFRKIPFEKRVSEFRKINIKYPNRVPIIVRSDNVKFSRRKFLAPKELKISNFHIVLRRNITNINQAEAIFLFTKNNLLSSTNTLGEIYNKYKDSDGFLYITASKESTFG